MLDSPKSNFIKSYFEKSMYKNKSEIHHVKKKSLNLREFIYDPLPPLEHDPNLTRHRANLTKSRISQDKLNTLKVHHSRDVSCVLDSKLSVTFDKLQESLQDELLVSIGLKESFHPFSMTTDLSELKKQITGQDLLMWSLNGPNNVNLSEFSHEFVKEGILKQPQQLRFGELGAPSKRKEVEMLSGWLDFMLAKILEESSQNKAEIFENAQIVYTACLNEIFRQISVHCSDRGELLQRIWRAYFSVMVKTINVYQISKISLQKRYAQEISSLKEKYSQEIFVLDEKISEKSEKISSLSFNTNELELQLKRANIKCEELKHRILVLQSQYSKDKVRLIRLEDDYRNLRELQRMVLEDIDENIPGYKKVQPKGKIRFRELSKLFLADPLCGNLTELVIPEIVVDVKALIELDKIDLENKVKMHEIQGRIEETAEELIDIGVDTRDLARYCDKHTETDINDFPISTVGCYVDQYPPRDLVILEQILLEKIKEESWNSEELESYFGKITEGTVKKYDIKLDIENEHLINEEVLSNFPNDQQKQRFRGIVRKITSNIISNNKRKIESLRHEFLDLNEKIGYEKNEKMRLRKQIFVTYRENVKLKDEIEKLKEQLAKIAIASKRKRLFTRAVRATKKIPTVVKEFKFNRKVVLFKKDSISPAEAILKKTLMKNAKKPNKVNIRPVTLMKIINTLITDYISMLKEENMIQAQPLHIFIYDYFSVKHGGHSKVLESKYQQFLIACEFNKKLPFVNLFCRFIGLFDPLKLEFFRTSLLVLELLQKCNRIGVDIILSEIDDTLLPAIRCNEVISQFFNDKFLDSEISMIKNDMSRITKPCPRCINVGVVERSEFLLFIIQHYSNFVELSTNNVRDLFDAADLNGDKFLQFDEFDLLFRSIEAKRYKRQLSQMCFDSYSDLIAEKEDNNYPAISYDRFATFALEKDYFRIAAQNQFFGGLDPKEVCRKIQVLHNRCGQVIKEMQWRLKISRRNSSTFTEMIENLRGRLLENDQRNSVYMAYMLLNHDSKWQLVDSEIEAFLPSLQDYYVKAKDTYITKKSELSMLKRQLTWKSSIDSLDDWDDNA